MMHIDEYLDHYENEYGYLDESEDHTYISKSNNVYMYDKLSKSILLFHHYASMIVLICTRLE